MPSPSQTSIDLPVTTFGGLVTQYDSQALPSGASPFCQDVAFSGVNPAGGGIVGGWASRPGMGAGFYATPFAGNPTVNYVKTFTDSTGAIHTLSIDGLGIFRDESPSPTVPGVPSIIGRVIAASYIQSDALFNREFMAIGDGNEGLDIPRQWDGTYFDRVSQVGPGAPPACADGAAGNVDAGLHQIAVAFITREQYITRPSPYVNYTAPGSKKINLTNIPTGPPNIIARVILATGVITAPAISGDFYFFDGSVPTPSAGTFPSMVINDNTTTSYTIDFISAVLENTPIATNLYNMLELGECAQFTAYSDRIFAVGERNNLPNMINPTFDGGFNATVAGTTVGPNSPAAASGNTGAGTVAWLNPGNVFALDGAFASFPISGGFTFYVSKQLQASNYGFAIPPGSTIVGISAAVYVKQSYAVGPRFTNITDDQVYLMKAGAVVGANRANNTDWTNTVAPQIYGGPNDLWGTTWLPADINNLGFGLSFVAFAPNAPGGSDGYVDYISITVYYAAAGAGAAPLGWTQGATFAGGGSALQSGLSAYWGDAFSITGDGATAVRGLITQSMFQDFLGNTILQPNTPYRVRVRLGQNGTLAAGVLHINLQSATGAFTTMGLAIPFSSLTASYAEFQAFLTDVPLSTIPADIVMQVYADGTPTLNGVFLVDCIEVYPANFPVNRTLIRASYAEQPEAFDELTGLLSINAGDGQAVRLTFNILDNKLYIVKDRSMYSTQDDGQNEPDLWSISTVSNTVGTLSNRGVGIGESWAVIASKQGAYIFWGSEPVKISQEIQPTWDQINWNFGYTMYVVVDTNNKRIHIGAPLGAATSPNVEFVCDYSQLANSEGATSAQDIASHPQAYYSVYQPTKLTAPGKARKWTIWNIKMNCAALTIRSDNSIHLLRGNGTGTGKIYDQLPTNLNDDGENAIPVMYQTAYFPQTEDEQVLQLGAHRKTCTYMTGYVFGAGTLIPLMYGAQDQRGKVLTQLPLVNPEQWDFEMNVNFVAERMSILFTISGLTSWVQMTKLCPTIQRDVMTPVRGSK
jgi:hypothetical protein